MHSYQIHAILISNLLEPCSKFCRTSFLRSVITESTSSIGMELVPEQTVAVPLAPVALPRITIKFCTQCKWMLRAAYVCQTFSYSYCISLCRRPNNFLSLGVPLPFSSERHLLYLFKVNIAETPPPPLFLYRNFRLCLMP